MTRHENQRVRHSHPRQRLDCGCRLPLSLTMRTTPQSALTKIDVVTIIATLTLLAFLIGPALRSGAKSSKTHCINNLKNIGLAFRIYSLDASDAYVPARLLAAGVPMDSIDAALVFRQHSNEISAPFLFVCPSDKQRTVAKTMDQFATKNLSYFASLSAEETEPLSFLAGDRNLLSNNLPITGLFPLLSNQASQISWSRELHNEMGNISMGDGSVLQFNSLRLKKAIADQDLATNYISIP